MPFLVTIHGNGSAQENYYRNTAFLSESHAANHSAKYFVYNGVDPTRYTFQSKKDDYFVFLARTTWRVKNVKTAIAWARANVDKFGGDRNFVAISGASAGGHLAALAGLTANDPEMQDELPEGSDTSVDAVVGIYGRYDWEDKSTVERVRFMDFLERVVVRRKFDRHPELFRKASPMARVHPEAPPFLVVHGTGDSVIPVAQAQSFVERLRGVSRSVVGYVELPGAGHGFDMTDGARTGAASTAIGLFLNHIHRNRTLIGAKEVI